MRDYLLYLTDIIKAMERIQDFVKGMDYTGFKGDDKTRSAVIQKLEIIGEATKQIPMDIRERHPQIPWKELAGMRDRLIHAYFSIDVDLVWRIIINRIPRLKPLLESIINAEQRLHQ
ncbi:MAG: HepT-like ribonuclease domain-containing protein [Candidatus Ranarchaeia archaeon]